MGRLWVIALLLCLGLEARAQMIIVPREKLEAVSNPRLSLKSASFRFDHLTITAQTMSEDDGIQSFSYPFENVGSDTLRLGRLVTTCSCASALCSKMTVAPGETSEITVKYNPKGHPGRFERKVFVYVAGEEAPAAVLKLSVNVENGSDMSGLYPVSMGSIRVRRNEVDFIRGVKAVESCVFINLSDSPMRLECERALMPICLSFSTEPEVVGPGEEGRILISYNPAAGGERPRMPVMIKGLGVPPTQSAITVIVKEK